MPNDINERAMSAKSDDYARNCLIEDYENYILHCAYKTTHHHVTKSDDEWSVGLIAFSQAIDSFEQDKGNFLSYAGLVIRSRLTDYYRKQAKYAMEVNTSPFIFDGNVEEEEEVKGQHQIVEVIAKEQHSDIRDEIEAVTDLLKQYGISFFDLTKCSPKTEKTRKECAVTVKCILLHEELLQSVLQKKVLPITEILQQCELHRKVLERHRRYLIAAVLILTGDYPKVSEYLHFIREEMSI